MSISQANAIKHYESRLIQLGQSDPIIVTLPRMNVLAHRLKEAREKLGLSQADLAERVPVRPPCSQTVIARIEVGQTRNPRYIYEIAQALGVSVGWLKGETNDPTPEKVTEKPIPPEYMAVLQALWDVEKTDPERAAAWRKHILAMADLVSASKGEKPEK